MGDLEESGFFLPNSRGCRDDLSDTTGISGRHQRNMSMLWGSYFNNDLFCAFTLVEVHFNRTLHIVSVVENRQGLA
jgi:hypothetical protein